MRVNLVLVSSRLCVTRWMWPQIGGSHLELRVLCINRIERDSLTKSVATWWAKKQVEKMWLFCWAAVMLWANFLFINRTTNFKGGRPEILILFVSPDLFISLLKVLAACFFLAPTGAQEVTICVCAVQVCLRARYLYLLGSDSSWWLQDDSGSTQKPLEST